MTNLAPSHAHSHAHPHAHSHSPLPQSQMHGHNHNAHDARNAHHHAHDDYAEKDIENGMEETAPLLETSSSSLAPAALPSPIGSPSKPSDTGAPPSLKCLCFDFALLPINTRFVVLTVGVCFFFLLNSYVEEYTFKVLPKFEYGWYLTFFELLSFAFFAVFERIFLTRERLFSHTAPLSRHVIVAVAMTASRGLTNVSLQFLNYPTQIIFKSMKLLTVMIGSLCILNNSFTISEYVSALLLVLSACMFSLGDIDVSPSWSVIGVVIVLLSLVADAIHSNTQDSLLREHKSSTNEAMLFTNFFAAMMTLVYVLGTGELLPALEYCRVNSAAYGLFTLRSIVIYSGVLCFVLMIKAYGVVMATAVTTVRKIASILISFYFFPKAFSMKYVFGFLGFIASVAVQMWGKQDSRNREKGKVREGKV